MTMIRLILQVYSFWFSLLLLSLFPFLYITLQYWIAVAMLVLMYGVTPYHKKERLTIPKYIAATFISVVIVSFIGVSLYKSNYITINSPPTFEPNVFFVNTRIGETTELGERKNTTWCDTEVWYYDMEHLQAASPPCELLPSIRRIIFAPYPLYINHHPRQDVIDISRSEVVLGTFSPGEIYISTIHDPSTTLYHELGHAFVKQYSLNTSDFCKFKSSFTPKNSTWLNYDGCEEAFADIFAAFYTNTLEKHTEEYSVLMRSTNFS